MRRYIALYNIINLYLITLLVYHVIILLFSSFEFIIDSLLVFLILIAISNYRYTSTLQDILIPSLPLIMLVSVIIGIYLGIYQPLRYLLLTIIDMISSSVIFLTKASARQYVYALLLAVFYYNSPIIRTQSTTLLVFLLIHVVRNIAVFNNKLKSKKRVGLMLSIDLLTKLFAVRFI
ncbi:MAG: hypothetical protein QXE81_01905 [Desulfurococcaceae archaeon]